jgi:hypothetical protein
VIEIRELDGGSCGVPWKRAQRVRESAGARARTQELQSDLRVVEHSQLLEQGCGSLS